MAFQAAEERNYHIFYEVGNRRMLLKMVTMMTRTILKMVTMMTRTILTMIPRLVRQRHPLNTNQGKN